jgi:hypothetical protein
VPRRADITQTLVHFVSAESNAAALGTLWRIVSERRILGSTRLIKGEYPCVCFTETPVELVAETLLEAEDTQHRYKPFGIAVQKRWLFAQSGRPVIYGPPDQFEQLPEPMRWRHMRYDPTAAPPVDFTWEREWRLNAEALAIAPDNAELIVPDRRAFDELESLHDAEELERFEVERWELEQINHGEAATPPMRFLWGAHWLS